jgi:hypothetical protein
LAQRERDLLARELRLLRAKSPAPVSFDLARILSFQPDTFAGQGQPVVLIRPLQQDLANKVAHGARANACGVAEHQHSDANLLGASSRIVISASHPWKPWRSEKEPDPVMRRR